MECEVTKVSIPELLAMTPEERQIRALLPAQQQFMAHLVLAGWKFTMHYKADGWPQSMEGWRTTYWTCTTPVGEALLSRYADDKFDTLFFMLDRIGVDAWLQGEFNRKWGLAQ